MQDLDPMSVKVVDRAFLRAAQLGAAALVALFIGTVLLLFLARRLFPAHPPDLNRRWLPVRPSGTLEWLIWHGFIVICQTFRGSR